MAGNSRATPIYSSFSELICTEDESQHCCCGTSTDLQGQLNDVSSNESESSRDYFFVMPAPESADVNLGFEEQPEINENANHFPEL
jgi:hypothetical protein